MRPRSEVSGEEATQYPIFLLQSGQVIVFSEPSGYYHDGEGFRPDSPDDTDDDWEYLTNQQLLDMGSETATRIWNTELVFADRDEAEEYARGRAYNYPDGWRVYCVPCKGNLAATLATATP